MIVIGGLTQEFVPFDSQSSCYMYDKMPYLSVIEVDSQCIICTLIFYAF